MEDKNEENGTLAIFTALEPLATGGLVGLLAAAPLRQESGLDWAAIIVLVAGILALGVSLLHLGRPWRAPLAILRASTSWLSREVFLFGFFLLFLAGYALLPLGNIAHVGLGILSVLCGLTATAATGETYRLQSRPAWNQTFAAITFPLSALSMGSLFGFFLVELFYGPTIVNDGLWITAAGIACISLLNTLLRSTRKTLSNGDENRSRQLTTGSYVWLLVLRILMVLATLALALAGGETRLYAWVPALLGEMADRFLFFSVIIPVSLRERYL